MEKGTLLPVSQRAQLRNLLGSLPLWIKSTEKETRQYLRFKICNQYAYNKPLSLNVWGKRIHMKISKLDHFVLTVRDIEKTISFYTSVMGMEKEAFGQGRVALKCGDQKINLHEFGNEFQLIYALLQRLH
jgi:hypothetical protein